MTKCIPSLLPALCVAFLSMVSMPSLNAAENKLRIGTFHVDASPPIGSPMAYDPCVEITEPLACQGIVLLGSEQPIVLIAIDWLGIGNESHDQFRDSIAAAANTDRTRVMVHALHQHDAPRSDFGADLLLSQAGSKVAHFDRAYMLDVIKRTEAAVKEALKQSQPFDQVGVGIAEVREVASNRRLMGPDGKVVITRYTACADEMVRALPVGTIDPLVRSISFWKGETPLAVLTYYATHPQSYYRTGKANPDFPGMARNAREKSTGIRHIHFDGAGGNIGAGKWNDGSVANRAVLAKKVETGMQQAWESTKKFAIKASDVKWVSTNVVLPFGSHLDPERLTSQLNDSQVAETARLNAAEQLAYIRRQQSGKGIDLGCLHLGNVSVLHMPGELFVEYQLAAQQLCPDRTVATAAYGDYGPQYIGTKISYSQGGYETSPGATCVGSDAESILMPAIAKLLGTKWTGDKPLGVPPDAAVQLSSKGQ